MTRTKGIVRTCDTVAARRRLIDAQQFLEAAEILDAPDVIATNAIHAAIAAADAICCVALGERSVDGKHSAAVDLIRKVDSSLASALRRALDRKTQAGYDDSDLALSDAVSCVRWARLLVEDAQRRLP